jgi:hypothetical protein
MLKRNAKIMLFSCNKSGAPVSFKKLLIMLFYQTLLFFDNFIVGLKDLLS